MKTTLTQLIPNHHDLSRAVIVVRLLELVTELITTARTDSMTGILNRRALFEDHGDFVRGNFVTVIDVDGLKAVNDTQGHEAGDTLIRVVAQSLKTMGDAYRLGGDEMVLVSMDPVFSVGLASIGCVAVDPSLTLGELLALADQRMYEAKASHLRKRPR